ncbi:MAG: hypothetical protein AB7N80_05870 [Bdellovibrionales bacterium]
MTTAANARKARSILKNRRGLATVESIPLIVIFIMLSAYAMGMWGSVHTAILHSIAARTYAFETFRNRTDLRVFRENTNLDRSNLLSYANFGMRLHAVGAESRPDDGKFYVSRRPLSVGFPPAASTATREDHLTRIFEIQPRNQSVDVGPIWLMIAYGICLDAQCGR